MCGRYAVYSEPKIFAKLFAIKQTFDFETSYNVAPTESIKVVIQLPDGENIITSMRWGLIPGWQNTPNLSSALINARIETIDTKPSFRQAVKKRRCLIIADGFYEWRSEEKLKQPYFIQRKDEKPFGMAGIWERWVGEGTSIDSCCIVTLPANNLLSTLHDRMPAIIKSEDYSKWLNCQNQSWNDLQQLLQNNHNNELQYFKVSRKMNASKYKNADCISKI